MVVVFLSSALSIGPGYAFGMFIKPLQNEFAWSTTEISFALSFAAAGTIFSPFLGSFMDKYGSTQINDYSSYIYEYIIFTSSIYN
ncbi:MAG: hypothetical protein ACJ0A6_04810 [Dehalococcoidia bacterium]